MLLKASLRLLAMLADGISCRDVILLLYLSLFSSYADIHHYSFIASNSLSSQFHLQALPAVQLTMKMVVIKFLFLIVTVATSRVIYFIC